MAQIRVAADNGTGGRHFVKITSEFRNNNLESQIRAVALKQSNNFKKNLLIIYQLCLQHCIDQTLLTDAVTALK